MRIWRKKNKLLFIIPELLDEIAKLNFDSNKTLALCLLNIFYTIYNGINIFNSKQNQGNMPKHKILFEKLFKNLFENENNKKKIKEAILQTNKLINNKNIEEVLKIEDE